MFRQIKLTVLCLMLAAATAASQEFEEFENGLMYDESTMARLEYIVDSLNLMFKQCDPNSSYRSLPQAECHYVRIEGRDARRARSDIENGMQFEDLLNKYSTATVQRNLPVVVSHYEAYRGESSREFSSMPFESPYFHKIVEEGRRYSFNFSLGDSLIFDYDAPTAYSTESLRAFYFISDFTSSPIPRDYAAMIQYVDCMVDTNTVIHPESAPRDYSAESEAEIERLREFTDRLITRTATARNSRDPLSNWDFGPKRMDRIRRIAASEPDFKQKIIEMVEIALKHRRSSELLEQLAEHYHSAEAALELKRSRTIWGSCSMDESPRIHARHIALLSAETARWDVFLRAHLDIMNDRFTRATDGSYAWDRRETYIRELEELNINVPQLILGMVLRIDNPSYNHYSGNVRRLGRALAETRYREEFESHMSKMINDSELDTFNRMLIYYLYRIYTNHLDDKEVQLAARQRLKTTMAGLPAKLLKGMDEDFD